MFSQNIFSVGIECNKNVVLDAPAKEKRSRTAFTTEQLNYLEQEYINCPYSEHDRLCNIANIIRKPEKVVKVWFQNRRSRERKSNKQSVTGKNKLDISVTNKSVSPTVLNMYTNKPTPKVAVAQIDYEGQFCQMAEIQNMMSKTNQQNRVKDFNTSKQAVNLHNIVNNVRKEAYPKLNPVNCKHNTTKTKTKMSTSKINKNGLDNTSCFAHPNSTERKPGYNFVNNNPNLPNLSNFFLSSNNSAINFAPRGLPGFQSKSGQINYTKGVKQEKNMHHNMFQTQEPRKSPKKCNCNCNPKSNQSGAQNIQNPQVPYVIIIPCLK